MQEPWFIDVILSILHRFYGEEGRKEARLGIWDEDRKKWPQMPVTPKRSNQITAMQENDIIDYEIWNWCLEH